MLLRDVEADVPEGSLVRSQGPGIQQTMQFSSLYEEGTGGFYFGAYDAEGYRKSFDLTRSDGFSFFWSHFPAGPEIDGRYRLPYDVVLGVFRGSDWRDAADIYKRWGTQQEWCALGRYEDRPDVPRWWKQVGNVLKVVLPFGEAGRRTLQAAVQKAGALAASRGYAILLKYWGWNKAGVFRLQPEWRPAHLGDAVLRSAVGEAARSGARSALFYVGQQADQASQQYQSTFLPYRCMDATGKPYLWVLLGNSGSPVTWVAMCPAARPWVDFNVDFVRQMARDYGLQALYLDVDPTIGPYLCYNADHGHPVGGGNWFHKATKDLLVRLRAAGRAVDPEFVLLGEEVGERYIRELDAFWLPRLREYLNDEGPPILTQYGGALIPMFGFVYHEYCRTVQGDWPGPFPEWGRFFYYSSALALVDGSILVVSFHAGEADPQKWEYMLRIMDATQGYGSRYLLYGESLRPPTIDVPPLALTNADMTSSVRIRNRSGLLTVPSVLHSAWKARDGSVGYVFTNIADRSQTFSFMIDPSTAKLDSAKDYVVQEFRNGAAGPLLPSSTIPRNLTVTINPRDVLLIVAREVR